MVLTAEALKRYLEDCSRWAMSPGLFVLGHPAPDGDAVVSSLMEGWRRTLSGTPAVAVVQAPALPREAAWLLGEWAPEVTLLADAPGVAHPDSRFILTDHHDGPYLSRTVGVVDHHPLSPDVTLPPDTRLVRVGAATTLVTLSLQEAGYTPDEKVARILLGGILLDTDGLSPYKAKPEDTAVAGWLAALCGEDMPALFATLQGELLSETDVAVLFARDYRLYTAGDGTPVLGFAILKVWRDAFPDVEAVRALLAVDVARRDLSAGVAKIVGYLPDGRREELYLTAGAGAPLVLAALDEATGTAALPFPPDGRILPTEAPHPGRKRLAGILTQRLTEKEEKAKKT